MAQLSLDFDFPVIAPSAELLTLADAYDAGYALGRSDPHSIPYDLLTMAGQSPYSDCGDQFLYGLLVGQGEVDRRLRIA